MFAAVTPALIFLAAAVISVRADPNPNNPGPGDVFVQGRPCDIGWEPDKTGGWGTMEIDLMTGDNLNMIFLTTVATVDGTDPNKNTYTYTCPLVSPHSAIYFYQFSSPSTSNKTWTGRFTITDSANDIVPPSQSTQPDGEKIPWGIGSLVNGSSSQPSSMPSTANGTVGGLTSSLSITPGSPLQTAASSGTPTLSVVYATSNVSVAPSTTSTAGTNGAATMFGTSNVALHAGLVLGLAAVGFAMVF